MNIINIYSLKENNKDVMVLKYILNCYKEALVQIKTEKNYADKDYIKREAA